jgi:hypothetical protein
MSRIGRGDRGLAKGERVRGRRMRGQRGTESKETEGWRRVRGLRRQDRRVGGG